MTNLDRYMAYVKNFLFRFVNKEFLIFLFFLVLSGIFWLLMTLNETYEKELKIPISLTNTPQNVIITSQSVDTITVTVKDKGFSLLAYITNKQQPVNFNFETFANKTTGKGTVSSTDMIKAAYAQLFGSSRITGVKPDHIEYFFNYGESKLVPVRLAGTVMPEKSYYLAGKKIIPGKVTVYARKSILDSIRYVTTTDLNIANFSDTVVKEVALKQIKGIKTEPSTVKIMLYPDILTERTVEVPITAINMPEGKVLRTFPTKALVRFSIGASMYRNVKAEQFKVVADYQELVAHSQDKCTLHLKIYPPNVAHCSLENQKVDYLIEQQ